MNTSINVMNLIPESTDLIKPVKMLDWEKYPHGTVFQQYSHGKPTKDYYITTGVWEKRVISIWWSDESDSYQLSSDTKKSLKEFSSDVKMKKMYGEATISVILGERIES